jgi:hypothetical protein
MDETERAPAFEGWAVLELMGHRKLAGKVTEAEIAGKGFLRLDVPGPADASITQYYSPAAVYALTPVTEEMARAVSRRYQPEPVSRYDLLPPMPPGDVRDAEIVERGGGDADDDDDDDFDEADEGGA